MIVMKVQTQIKQTAFLPDSNFIGKYQKLIKETVIPYQYEVLNDNAAGNSEKSHVIQNFINAGKTLKGQKITDGFYGMVFQDSDAAKWIEAAAYSLSIFPDEKLEKTVDELIEIIAGAQDQDGYLNTYFTIKDKDRRWKNIHDAHELYCAGHMMEAACAYYETTGKRKLLDVMLKNMECIYRTFIEGNEFQKAAYPGHPEVELALLKMYRASKNPKALELAKHFVDVRGVDADYYTKEMNSRNWNVWGGESVDNCYHQADLPVRKQTDAKGHAVRAVYLYTGMADLASIIEDKELSDACERLWKSITQKQMYITGGIGSTVLGEAFSTDYDLPSDTAYCETCASIGLMFFASRMLEMNVDRKYADVMEKAFYNTVLGGMQSDGKRFFYVNPLEVVPGIAHTAKTHMHVLTQRPAWFACACCPPNAARLISSFGKYAYGENENTVFCHLFASGKIEFDNGMILKCSTEYPYAFKVEYTIEKAEKKNYSAAIRIPGWSRKWKLYKNGELIGSEVNDLLKNGYAYIEVEQNDRLTLELDESAYFVYPNRKIPDLNGQVAVCRGPFVYCAEGVDNHGNILGFRICDDSESLCIENEAVYVKGKIVCDSDELYSIDKPAETDSVLKMIPYYTWGNRGENQMKVWFPVL